LRLFKYDKTQLTIIGITFSFECPNIPVEIGGIEIELPESQQVFKIFSTKILIAPSNLSFFISSKFFGPFK
jgi:hypothetical protein